MNYTKLTLILLGIFGMILHSFIELNKLNKANKGNDISLTIKSYLKLEVFSLLISFFGVIAVSIISNEIEIVLEKLGYAWAMGGAFMFLGYATQSILVFAMGRAGKKLDNLSNP